MTVSSRDRRALIILAAAVVIVLVISLLPQGGGTTKVVAPADSVRMARERLDRVRRLAALVPARKKELKHLKADLGKWESGLIRSETAQQAQAELLQVLRRIGASQTPPLEFRSTEIGQVRGLGNSTDYGEALVTVSFDCAIEQLVNLLADLTAQAETVVTDQIRINPGNKKQKLLHIRLTVAGLIPHRLVPKQKGLVTF